MNQSPNIQNGPIHVANDYSIYANNFSWDKLADHVWIDQPVYVSFLSMLNFIDIIISAELVGQPPTPLVIVGYLFSHRGSTFKLFSYSC